MTQQVQGVLPSGTVRLIFRCEAPANTGVLFDDLVLSPFQPFSSAAEAWPAMIRMEANGILRFSLTNVPASYAGMSVTVDMSPSDDLGDIESVSLYTGDANSIYSTPAYGSSGHGAMSSPGILASPASRRAPVMTFPVTPGRSRTASNITSGSALSSRIPPAWTTRWAPESPPLPWTGKRRMLPAE